MSPRQKLLLKAIIEEFIETAVAVGSLNIPKKYSIKASPATIRNEMSKLVKDGYLKQPHSSSGRIPTTRGLKFYLQELIEQLDEVEHEKEFTIRESFHQNRFSRPNLIRDAINALVDLTGNAAIILIDDHIYYGGVADLVTIPELQQTNALRSLLSVIEDYRKLMDLFNEYNEGKEIKVLIGEELGMDQLEDFSIVFTPIKFYNSQDGFISVIGPNRMHYSKVVPALKFVANSIEDVIKGW